MNVPDKAKTIIQFLILIGLIIFFSLISTRMWGGKPEAIPIPKDLAIQGQMTVEEFGKINGLANPVLKKVFGLVTKQDLERKLGEFKLSPQEISARVEKSSALEEEEESKNWTKIYVKFALWFVFLFFVFRLMRKARIEAKSRKKLYLGAVVIFGILLGSDPSPMGTVKDAIALLGAKGVIFPPRAIALTVFLILVLLANKFICSWGCQLGTLQALIFRLNRNPEDKKGIFQQVKVPFAVTNSFRMAFFALFWVVAFLWATDMVEPIDPFKIYKPSMIGIMGGIFLGGLLIASLFIYRPWCHFFCPFGFVGWLVEKISIFKIQVNYDTCIACESCARACPSTVMGAILKQERVIPDCFACATCIGVCPTHSIALKSGRRSQPPADKFSKREKQKG